MFEMSMLRTTGKGSLAELSPPGSKFITMFARGTSDLDLQHLPCHPQRPRRSNQQVLEGGFESGAKVFPKDEYPCLVAMHLEKRLWKVGAIRCTFVPLNLH
jgi:hypothetical protein